MTTYGTTVTVTGRNHFEFSNVAIDPAIGGYGAADTSIYLGEFSPHNMTNADCLALLMGDDPPQEIENLLYRFLTSLFRRRLGI